MFVKYLAASFLLIATFVACGSTDPGTDSIANEPGMSSYPVEEATAATSQAVVAQCSGTPGQWAGCRGHGCAVCSETTEKFPYYFVNHPKCEKNLTCDGQFYTCNSNCPKPTAADKSPAAGQCNGTQGQWNGCRG